MEELAIKVDVEKDEHIEKALDSCIGTKFVTRWGKLITNLALKATRTIMRGGNLNKLNLEIKRYAKVEKVIYSF